MVAKKMGNEKALEEGPLERLFTGPAMAKILDFLILFRNYDYSKTDIAKNSGVNFRTVLRLLPILEEKQIVKKTRLVGQAKMYQINIESPLARALHELNQEIAFYDAEKIAKQELRKEQQTIPA